MSEQPKYDEIIRRLEDIQDNLEALTDRFDTEITAVHQAIAAAEKAAVDAPNRTDTVLEKNQKTIFKVACENRDLIKSLGAEIQEIKEDAETQS